MASQAWELMLHFVKAFSGFCTFIHRTHERVRPLVFFLNAAPHEAALFPFWGSLGGFFFLVCKTCSFFPLKSPNYTTALEEGHSSQPLTRVMCSSKSNPHFAGWVSTPLQLVSRSACGGFHDVSRCLTCPGVPESSAPQRRGVHLHVCGA